MNNPLVQLDPGLFLWTILTFLVLLGVLAKFAWNPLLKMLRDREELIRSSLDDAEKARAELERLNSEGEDIVNKARSVAQTILSEGKAAASKLKDETLNAAKSEVVDLSLSVATKLIKKNISREDNQALIDDSMENVTKYEA